MLDEKGLTIIKRNDCVSCTHNKVCRLKNKFDDLKKQMDSYLEDAPEEFSYKAGCSEFESRINIQ